MSTVDSEQIRSIALITSGGTYAERILVGLGLRGVTVDTILFVQNATTAPSSLLGKLRRGVVDVAARAGLPVGSAVDGNFETTSSNLTGLARRIVPAGAINSAEMIEALRQAAPDYLVLGGLGILGQAALELPKLGTINVHPALLPFARGVGVVARSIERGLPVGVTAHFVDRGIDTGQIIRRELIPVTELDTLGSLRRKAAQRSIEIMVELVAGMAAGIHPASTAQTSRFPYCQWPTSLDEQRIEQQLRSGAARETYIRWLDAYGAHLLPADVEERPRVEAVPLP